MALRQQERTDPRPSSSERRRSGVVGSDEDLRRTEREFPASNPELRRTEREFPASDPELRRTGRKLAAPGVRFIAVGLVPLVAGLLLFFLANSWPWVLGIVLIALSMPILGVGFSLLLGSGVARWAARRWPFA